MPVFWMTYRISEKVSTKGTYQERYENLKAAIEGHVSEGSSFWDRTTSFHMVESSSSAREIAVSAKEALSSTYDLFLIREIDNKNAYIFGDNSDNEIFDLMKNNGKTYLLKLK